MKVLPVLDEGLGNQSYVVALPDSAALVIDPSRDPRPYLELASREGLKIAFAAETHLHADFVSGSRELAAKGAVVVAPAAAELEGVGYRGLTHGDEFEVDGLTLRALATPGHTPEHLSYLLLEESTPRALFSGGALIPGGAARTDLIDPDQTEPLARALYRSVRQHLAGLPDDLVVYPTHGAGSFCSTGAGGERTTTLGRERDTNPLLTLTDEDTFVRTFLEGFGTYPSYFRTLRAVNRRGAPVYGVNPPQLRPLTVEELRREIAAGAALIDARSLQDFANGHIAGAISISLRPAFASWLGWLLPADRPLLFVMAPEQDRTDLVAQALKIGYERLVGELAGGMASWRAQSLPESKIALLHADDDLGIAPLDVRQDNEWAAGHIPGAVHVELGGLPQSAVSVPAGPLTIYCGHGERAMSAASLLEVDGHRQLAVLEGGFEGWEQAGGVGVSG
jgi:hydroxyacylglutathione hydrolase